MSKDITREEWLAMGQRIQPDYMAYVHRCPECEESDIEPVSWEGPNCYTELQVLHSAAGYSTR